MRAEVTSKLHPSRERARAAREFANQCKQRAAILFCSAEVLFTRFDELERRMFVKTKLFNKAVLRAGRR